MILLIRMRHVFFGTECVTIFRAQLGTLDLLTLCMLTMEQHKKRRGQGRGYWLALLACRSLPHSGTATGKRVRIITLWESSACSRHQHLQVTRSGDWTTRVETIASLPDTRGWSLEKKTGWHQQETFLFAMIQCKHETKGNVMIEKS